MSDNASVDNNWPPTIALPQYIVDQGISDVPRLVPPLVLIIFLENNHVKWLAGMLFGQLQTRDGRPSPANNPVVC